MKTIKGFILLFLMMNMVYGQNEKVEEEKIENSQDLVSRGDKFVEVTNKEFFKDFFNNTKKSLVMVGENHSSSVASQIYPQLIEYHNKENGVNTLLIEFGPAEAYFYSKYLSTGDEKHLNYTIYAGYYKDWKEAWKQIYEFNKTLEKPLEIIGFDFDRTRIFGYALFSMLNSYESKPEEIDSLLNVIKSQEFHETYTVGYPTEAGLKFVAETKEILMKNFPALERKLKPDDMKNLKNIIGNHATNFNEEREQDITDNVVNFIKSSTEQEFLMLVGRDHTYLDAIYDNKPRLASYLKKESAFETLTGLILHENSQQWGQDYSEEITLFEIKEKIPWKEHFEALDSRAINDITIVPLEGELEPLNQYVDYVIIARNMGPIQF